MRLLGVILHQGLYIVMENVTKVRAGRWARAGGAGGPWRTSKIPQGNLVNFLRTRGRALVPATQLLQFSL